jgi:hypothetical protein
VTDEPLNDRKFTDREVREILKRAVENAPSRALAKTEGLSLSELQAIGEEVGIDPQRLEDAARELTVGTRSWIKPVIGAETVLNFERTVDVEFSPDSTHEILSLIRRVMGRHGDVTDVHGSVEWSVKGETGERHVTVSPRNGGTTIHGSANLTSGFIGTFVPAGIMGLMATFAGVLTWGETGQPLALVAAATTLPTLYAIVRTVLGRISRTEAAKLRRVVDELVQLVDRSKDDD